MISTAFLKFDYKIDNSWKSNQNSFFDKTFELEIQHIFRQIKITNFHQKFVRKNRSKIFFQRTSYCNSSTFYKSKINTKSTFCIKTQSNCCWYVNDNRINFRFQFAYERFDHSLLFERKHYFSRFEFQRQRIRMFRVWYIEKREFKFCEFKCKTSNVYAKMTKYHQRTNYNY